MPLPDSLPWMESVDAKVRRAKTHLESFYVEAATYAEKARPTFIRKTNHDRTAHWLVFYVEDPHPPIEISVIVGDFLHNLRSALDSLVCGLVHKTNPTSTCSGRQFPIFTDRDEYLKRRGDMLRGMPAAAVAIVDGVQPHCRPEASVKFDPLWILSTLNNHDKHRTAHLALCYNKDLELMIPLKRDGAFWRVQIDRSLYGGNVETVPLQCDPDLVADDMTVHVSGRTVLMLRSQESWADRPVDQLLVTCLQHVEDRVIPKFKPFFA
jgi:hypothetical protein